MGKAKKVEQIVEELTAVFDLNNPDQFKSPDTDNVYSVIARRVGEDTTEEIGLSLGCDNGRLIIRFCVFAEQQPVLKNLSFRFGSKKFTRYPLSDPPEYKPGCSLNKVEMKVFSTAKAERSDILSAINEDDGWDKLAEWVAGVVEAEGFKLVMADQGELAQFLPLVLIGVGIDKMVANIQYPGPLVKPKVPVAVVKPSKSDDGEFEDDPYPDGDPGEEED